MGDNAELEALFEQVREQTEAAGTDKAEDSGRPPAASGGAQPALFQRVGELTRILHDTLRELGYDQSLEKATRALPDARDRLHYIGGLTGDAANRALAAAEAAREHLGSVRTGAAGLATQWEKVYAGEADLAEFRRTADGTRQFLATLSPAADAADRELTEIIVAQGFQDLTGQVINRLVNLAADMERELVGLLVQASPGTCAGTGAGTCAQAASEPGAGLDGPTMPGDNRPGVCRNQQQVDELLDSLGF